MIQYIGLDDYFAIAAEQLGLDSLTVLRLSRVDLADSAFNAPRAEFAGVEFYPTLPMKVAVLLSRLVRNHPTARRQQADGAVGGDPVRPMRRVPLAAADGRQGHRRRGDPLR